MTNRYKLAALAASLGIAVFSTTVGAEEGASKDAAKMDASKIDSSSPKKSCESIVEAAKRDDFKSVKGLLKVSEWGKQKMASATAADKKKLEEGFDKMREEHMGQIKELKCGSEEVADDHAVVVSETEKEKRLIPFVKVGESWKFDTATYMSFYRESMKEHGVKMPGAPSSHGKSKGKG